MENKPPDGRKDDTDKPKWNLLPFAQVKHVVDVLTHGEKKYAAENWKQVKNPQDRYFAAAMRHITAWRAGEQKDPDTGRSPLAHACCDLLFLMWFDDTEVTKEKRKPMQIRCECGAYMVPTFDVVKEGRKGTGWECPKCPRTIMIEE